MSILYPITIKYFACFVFLNLFLIHKIKMTFFNIEVDTAMYFSEMVYINHYSTLPSISVDLVQLTVHFCDGQNCICSACILIHTESNFIPVDILLYSIA